MRQHQMTGDVKVRTEDQLFHELMACEVTLLIAVMQARHMIGKRDSYSHNMQTAVYLCE